ncbi:MAG: aminotransferase class III-fold pyridoxal phosphate-dependent enzyme [Bacteroidota bacterium]
MQLFNVYPLFDIEPVRGQGSYVFDKEGTSYLDFYGGHAVISIGHSHPHFVQAIQQQTERLVFYSNSVQNGLQQRLAHKLGQLSGCEDYQLFLCNSGAEANENALKLASFHTGRTKIIAFQKAFHGRTSAAVNITDNPKIQAPINKTFEVEYHPFNDLESVRQSLEKGDVCALIVEGIQGVGGIHVPDPSFLEAVAELCQKHGSLLILDEIQSGYGRSGKFFAFQYADIQPDLITVAKGMGNGFPIAGVLIHPNIKASYGLLGTTFGGNHLASAAGLAVLEVIEQEQLMAAAAQKGTYLMKQLQQLPDVESIRGHGLMIGLSFPYPVKSLRKQLLFEQKVFSGSSSDPHVLRLLPPLTITQEEADHFVQALHQTIEKAASLTH